MIQYNVHADNMDRACAVTPGKRSATVGALKDAGWYSVSALVKKGEQAHIMDELQKVGADSILIFAIDNSRM